MAIMIPSVISPDVKSSAEKRIFEWFKNAPHTDNWVVLHSMGIAQHVSLIQGEVDFLVLAPKYGIFALEVKGGRVKRENGMWYFTKKDGTTTMKSRGPFEQASDGIFSIMENNVGKRLDFEHKNISKLIYGYGVMVPDIEYETMGIDEEPWMVFDCKDKNNVRDFIIRLSKETICRWEKTYGPLPEKKRPTIKDVDYLRMILRRDFDKAVALCAKIDSAEHELIELTEKQYKCLDQIEENRRGIIYGPAGTGKTLLALKQVKKLVGQGKKVAFFCFNTNLGKWFQEHFKNLPEEQQPSYVGTFHSLLVEIAKKENKLPFIPTDTEGIELFYRQTLPDIVEEVLLEKDPMYDEIVIDEAQDLIEERYINIIDLLLKKGFEHGCWKMFGDFSRQAIYSDSKTGTEMLEEIEDRTSFIRCKLTENCRNTKQICTEIEVVTGFEAPSDLWSKIDGMPVDYRVFKTEDEELEMLENLLLELIDKHLKKGEITILSPYTREKSIVSRVEKVKIKDYSYKNGDNITFSTIHSFKGLDNATIILTDINSYSSEKLMYVALSRARAGLFVLESKNASNEYNQLVIRRKFS